MLKKKNHLIVGRLISIAIVCSLLAGILVTDKSRAQSLLNLNLNQTTQTVSQLGKISNDLLAQVLNASLGSRVNIIVQSNGPWGPVLDTLIALSGGQITSGYNNLNLRAVNLPASSVLIPALMTALLQRPTSLAS